MGQLCLIHSYSNTSERTGSSPRTQTALEGGLAILSGAQAAAWETNLAKKDMSRHHTPLNRTQWTTVRRAVFERDGWRCVECGKAGRLEVDHVTPMQREPGQDPFDPNGLQTLCRSCHIEKTATENRRALTPAEIAWRDLVNEMLP